MATRQTIDFLTHQFAQMRGVSPDNAVRIALMEALEREQERAEEDEKDASHASTIERTDARRLAFAGSCGAEQGLCRIGSDAFPPYYLIIMWLISAVFAPFVSRSLQFAYLFIVLFFLLFAYWPWRSVEKQREYGRQMRKSLGLGIEELGKGLPKRLVFLPKFQRVTPT